MTQKTIIFVSKNKSLLRIDPVIFNKLNKLSLLSYIIFINYSNNHFLKSRSLLPVMSTQINTNIVEIDIFDIIPKKLKFHLWNDQIKQSLLILILKIKLYFVKPKLLVIWFNSFPVLKFLNTVNWKIAIFDTLDTFNSKFKKEFYYMKFNEHQITPIFLKRSGEKIDLEILKWPSKKVKSRLQTIIEFLTSNIIS